MNVCCVNTSYISVSALILFLCCISTSTDFHSPLYASTRSFISFPFTDALHHICSYSAYLVLSKYFFSLTFTYVIFPFRECSLSLYKPDWLEIKYQYSQSFRSWYCHYSQNVRWHFIKRKCLAGNRTRDPDVKWLWSVVYKGFVGPIAFNLKLKSFAQFDHSL